MNSEIEILRDYLEAEMNVAGATLWHATHEPVNKTIPRPRHDWPWAWRAAHAAVARASYTWRQARRARIAAAQQARP